MGRRAVDIGTSSLATSNGARATGAGPRRYAASTRVLPAAHRIGIIFVELSIAIVVEVVADFGCWIVVAVAHDRATRAGGRTGRANAELSRNTSHSAAGIAVVDDTIAIVVETVAHFGGRPLITVADDHTHRAIGSACRANATLASVARRASTRIAVVHGAIAIVIEAITRFRRRIQVTIASDRAILTRRRPC